MTNLVMSILTIMISFITSLIIGYLIIPLLKKFKLNQQLNRYLEIQHKDKSSTPTMGGLIFILSTLFTLFVIPNQISTNYIIILFVFISYFLIGFIDDFLIIIKKNNKGLSSSHKFIMQIVVAIIFFYLFMKADNEPLLWIHTLGIKKNIGVFYGVFILLVLTASSNAVNLTDGLDGLAAGLSLISFLTFGLLSINAGWLEGYIEISYFSFALVGSLLGFLVYNSNPARVFMGDTGSLCLGASLGAIAILTRHEILLLIIGIAFVIETSSVILQILFYKLFKKKIFKMTPIHHTFELMGYKENLIVRWFWIIGLIASMISLIFGIVI